MADLQISQLPSLAEANIAATDELAIVDTSASETKKVTAKALVEKGVALIDAGSIPGTALASLGANTVVTNSITDANVTNVKLANSSISLGGLSLSLGSTDATPALDLTDATNYPTSSLTGTITNAQLAGSIANNKLANSSISIGGVSISLGTTIATPALNLTSATNYPTSSLTGTITNAQLAGSIANAKLANSSINIGGITFNLGDSDTSPALDLSDATSYPTSSLTGTITNAQLAGSITGSKLTDGTITATQLAANSVTASELADNAVDSGAIAASAVVDAKIASGIGGAKITDGTITAAKLATANIDRSLNVASGNLGINNTVTAATRSGITYNAQGLITGTVALAASDLPLATTSAVGGVSVGTGLAVTGAGALSLSNSVTAATISGITYNAQGQITATTALVAGDLPAATTSAKGAVLITSGGGISVDGSGAISTSTSGITAGTYTKVTINNKGVATAGASLVSGDVPDLSATKLTSGTLNVGRFATNSIIGSKFADSSVCQFTGAQSTSGVVTFPTAEFKGQFFYDLTNDDLYVYDGSAFQPVTITSGEIIYAGNYRADTNKITSLTAAGTAQGYTVGAALQAASAANNRYYFVCDKSGTGTSPAPTVTINPPDMILSNGSTYEKLDISNFIAGQVASNIGVTATGGIQNTNVQSVLEELDTEKLNTTGGTLTGNLALNQSSSIIFEGATPDDFETTLTVIDPTADRTVSLPNVTGTLVSTGDTGTVTSTMILDGTILNADINASAAIALTKLANVTAAHIIVGNASNVPTAVAVTGDISISNAGLVAITADSIVNADIKSDAAIAGSKIVAGTTSVVGVVQLTDSAASSSTTTAATPAAVKVAKDAADAAAITANAALPTTGGTLTNNLIIDNAKQIRFTEADANGANFVSLQAPDTLAADTTYVLPSAAPTANGQVLASTTGGVLSWTDDPTGQWVTNGTNVYYDGGNVGIGAGSSPAELLDVSSTGASAAIEISAGQASTTTGEAKLILRSLHSSSGTSYSRSEIASLGVAGGDSDLIFRTTTQIAGPEERMRIDSEGLVGIGTNPTSSLHVSVGSSGTNSSAGFNEFCIEGADEDIGMCFLSPAANNRTHTIAFGDSNNNNAGKIQYDHSTDDLTITASDNIVLNGDAVGIGVSPVDKLNVAGAVRINQSTTLDHLCNAGTVLEVRGDGIGSGVVDTDFFKGFKIALNDGPEYGGQAQFAVGRWEENGTNARSSLMISLGHGGISSSSNADADVLLLNSDKHAEFFGGLTVGSDIRATGASDVRLTLGSTGTVDTNNSVHVRADGANLNFMAASGGITKFEVNGTETLQINSNGSIAAGTVGGTYSLELENKINNDVVMSLVNSTANEDCGIRITGSHTGVGTRTSKIGHTIVTSGTGLQLHSPDNIVLYTGSTATERLRIDDNGIKFQGDTASTNALNDYEQGTYTPNLLAHGGSWSTVTLSSGSKYGSYVKIGNMVHVQAYFTDFHVDSAHDGDLVGMTLPIAVDSGSTGYSVLTTVHANCFVSGKQTNFFVISNSSNAYGIQEASTSYDTWRGEASRYLMVAGTYRAG